MFKQINILFNLGAQQW